ncbi:response regulator transcription factor [Erythrobacter sp. LQ02-29]|uniref:response regulator n=1 Tax=Erythrobacter sp. LQ02-29 TaxID=2920384 RepID=UPI001F4DE047|nr:response regulator transcription factor [Erythrobacter sp. LQ02-29]MCP9222372.1 response regulator transcription factor [Erythrobacter sp. LQ02-29]
MLRFLLIAEDHPLCFAALKSAAHARDSAIQVDGCDTLEGTIHDLAQRDYAALVLDLGLRDSEGVINLRRVRGSYPRLPILVISATDDATTRMRVRSFGARGFLSKKSSLEEMGEAILRVMAGETYFPTDEDAAGDEDDLLHALSPAQLRIMSELCKGNSNNVIAHNLDLSEATVKSHLSSIFKSLRVSNRAQAILKYGEMIGHG